MTERRNIECFNDNPDTRKVPDRTIANKP
jgi:hypothetical protein